MKRLIAGLVIGAFIGLVSPAGASSTVQAMFAKFNFVVNGEKRELAADPLLYNGTTYLPVRAVSDMLGYDVNYEAESRTIELNNKSIGNKGDVNMSSDLMIAGRPLIELIADKYNINGDNYKELSMGERGNLIFRGQEFQLEYEEDNNGRRYYNIQPLLNAGILTIEDLN